MASAPSVRKGDDMPGIGLLRPKFATPSLAMGRLSLPGHELPKNNANALARVLSQNKHNIKIATLKTASSNIILDSKMLTSPMSVFFDKIAANAMSMSTSISSAPAKTVSAPNPLQQSQKQTQSVAIPKQQKQALPGNSIPSASSVSSRSPQTVKQSPIGKK